MELAKDLESICSSCYCLPTCSCEDNEEELQGKIDLIDKEIDKEKSSNSSELELSDEKKKILIFNITRGNPHQNQVLMKSIQIKITFVNMKISRENINIQYKIKLK